jgi:hypothetical protein
MTNNISTIIELYNDQVKDLPRLHQISGGKARNGSGIVFETLVERICSAHDFVAKKNDYKRSEEIDGIVLKNLQVDKHIYLKELFKKAVEGKCYLDLCYFKRAVLDFIELYKSPDVPKDVEYAIFCGQKSINEDAIKYWTAYFKRETGKDLNIFVINTQKTRSTKRPIYKEEYNQDFTLDVNEVNRFVEWLKA